MPTLQIVSSRPGAGKSTIAVALAQGLAREGKRVRLERTGASPAAAQDAATFGEYLFAGSSGSPLAQPPTAAGDEIVLLELDAGDAAIEATPALIAVHASATEADKALAATLGDNLIGTIAVAVDPEAIETVARDLTNAGMRPLALAPEDHHLAAPSVSEIADVLDATVLFDADNDDEVVADILIAPIYSDPARPHFHRYSHKAILAPFNKTDLHLAAIESEAACLVITGGKDPSPYIVDRAHHGRTTLVLSLKDTPGTVASLGDVWTRSRFRGEAKAAAALSSLESRLDFSGLLKKLEG